MFGRRNKKITLDLWEGLQNELSYLKGQVRDIQAVLAPELLEFEKAQIEDDDDLDPDVLEAIRRAKKFLGDLEGEDDDWGLDTSWEERIPVMVSLVDGPPGLEIGPFVLITPEERASWAADWDRAATLCDNYLYQLEEQEDEVKSLRAYISTLESIVYPSKPVRHISGSRSWARMVQEGPGDRDA